ncbi:hypothetical protein HUT16_18765 [Kitasatospora sp. NA04385]|uniref:SecDF P1 head subdomain-containing protein n=1 Tax=Kitasatospora sp. NA04385 TaxID=2742135 RepID=UPI001591FEC4|nr:hypothetical protein [Kitasatospora sp. NA04385]QKW20833.1 hypothetical protein HUT16_18765 [Kitasatospora sp. NA04385]
MEHPRRTAGAAALLLACALSAAACDSGASPAPAPVQPTGTTGATSGTAAADRTTTVFATDRPLSGEALTRAAEQLRRRAELLGLPNPEVKADNGTLALTVAGPVGDRLAALTHRPALEFRPVLAAATAGPDAAAPTAGDVPAQWKDRFAALDCGDGAATPAPSAAPADPAAEALACGTEPAGGRWKFVLGPVAVKGEDIADSTSEFSDSGAGWQVRLRFTPSGGTAFADVTGRISTLPTPGNQFAIVLDGAVLSHPYVAEAITGGQADISGSFTEQDAKTLAAQLATPSLPTDLHPVTTTS